MSRCQSGRCSCEEDAHYAVGAVDHVYIWCFECGHLGGTNDRAPSGLRSPQGDRACYVLGDENRGTFGMAYFEFYVARKTWPRFFAAMREKFVAQHRLIADTVPPLGDD